MREIFQKRSRIHAPIERVFAWHERPDALELLNPPWDKVQIVERTGTIRDRGRIVLKIGHLPFQIRWIAQHTDYVPGRLFRDLQISGPFAFWDHQHRFEPDGNNACYLEDYIEYELPFGWLGRVFGGPFARRKLEKVFEYRHAVTRRHLEFPQPPVVTNPRSDVSN